MNVIYCQNCDRPMATLLDLGQSPSDDVAEIAITMLEEALVERIEDDLDTVQPVFIVDALAIEPTVMVYVTEKTGEFWREHLGTECLPDLPCWVEASQLDVPAWALRGRRQRWAYLWPECCNFDRLYVRAPSFEHAE